MSKKGKKDGCDPFFEADDISEKNFSKRLYKREKLCYNTREDQANGFQEVPPGFAHRQTRCEPMETTGTYHWVWR